MVFSAIDALISIILAFLGLYGAALAKKIADGQAESTLTLLGSAWLDIRENWIASIALFGVICLSVFLFLTESVRTRVFGPFVFYACEPKIIPLPIGGTRSSDYSIVVGRMTLDSQVPVGDSPYNNAIYGFNFDFTEISGGIEGSFNLVINGGTGQDKLSSILECESLLKQNIRSNRVEVFLIYPQSKSPSSAP